MSGAQPVRQSPSAGFRSCSRTHAGGRAVNEDQVLDGSAIGLWAVADGMGGHRGGGSAARLLIETLSQANPALSGYARLTEVVQRAKAVNAALFEQGAAREVSGTTLVALLAYKGYYACLWAGDSRAYVLRGGVLSPITRDHSVVQHLIDSGHLAEAGRRSHPQAHVITRAIGAGSSVDFEQRFGPLACADRFLLCSDGLSGCLPESQIARLMEAEDLEDAADSLMQAALSQTPHDNVSFVLVDFDQDLDA